MIKLFPKFKLSPSLVRFAYRLVDLEASGETASPDARIFEYSFVIGKLNSMKKGRVLDVGCSARQNFLPASLASIGWEVYGIDVREFKLRFPNFHFVLEDITNTHCPDNFFDVVCALSTLEHIGLGGRWGITSDDPDGDIKAVAQIKRILRPNGTFLVTVPYGRRRIVGSLHKVYDKFWLSQLFLNWKIKEEIYYVRNHEGYWEAVPEETAALVDNKSGEESIALLELVPLK
ncbi:class I SAM-dependent methyltransferase [Patescibacteria group bacterium]|nr:class I SAM-dependent methyltransferase [Patescibacteria group bacterium]